MKGLQGERLRQSFKYLDADQDGFIQPEQFKRIILVSYLNVLHKFPVADMKLSGNCWP
jgi:Ca2+-binding EF-hand superfamily protein